MSRPSPHILARPAMGDLKERLSNLDEALDGLSGLFSALQLLGEELGMSDRSPRTSAYWGLVNAGLRASAEADARSAAIHTLFTTPDRSNTDAA